ncbi:hypothetical protein LCGC14_1633550 [marine sediment metagenome]|uniref:Uncharacterized protein n=1 Tax=marine sediment metagenome TaxID=412755 RepID=A0A0F9L1K1_9ZZZZ
MGTGLVGLMCMGEEIIAMTQGRPQAGNYPAERVMENTAHIAYHNPEYMEELYGLVYEMAKVIADRLCNDSECESCPPNKVRVEYALLKRLKL